MNDLKTTKGHCKGGKAKLEADKPESPYFRFSCKLRNEPLIKSRNKDAGVVDKNSPEKSATKSFKNLIHSILSSVQPESTSGKAATDVNRDSDETIKGPSRGQKRSWRESDKDEAENKGAAEKESVNVVSDVKMPPAKKALKDVSTKQVRNFQNFLKLSVNFGTKLVYYENWSNVNQLNEKGVAVCYRLFSSFNGKLSSSSNTLNESSLKGKDQCS
jgi:hypothetical protein